MREILLIVSGQSSTASIETNKGNNVQPQGYMMDRWDQQNLSYLRGNMQERSY